MREAHLKQLEIDYQDMVRSSSSGVALTSGAFVGASALKSITKHKAGGSGDREPRALTLEEQRLLFNARSHSEVDVEKAAETRREMDSLQGNLKAAFDEDSGRAPPAAQGYVPASDAVPIGFVRNSVLMAPQRGSADAAAVLRRAEADRLPAHRKGQTFEAALRVTSLLGIKQV